MILKILPREIHGFPLPRSLTHAFLQLRVELGVAPVLNLHNVGFSPTTSREFVGGPRILPELYLEGLGFYLNYTRKALGST